MKNFTKISVCVIALSALVTGVKGQSNSGPKGIIYSIGVESGISSGNFNDAYGWNIGGSVQADIPVAENLYAIVNAGYLNFSGKNNINGTAISASDIRLLPAMAGFKYFPIARWFVQAAAGAGFVLNKEDLSYTKTAAFLYTPQIGVLFNVGGKNYIDAGLRYEGTGKYLSSNENSKINFFGLRIAYAFDGK